MPDGPYRASGVRLVRFRPLVGPDGSRVEWERGQDIEHEETFELCRCGHSSDQPFCDGTEKEIGFEGEETADRRPTSMRRVAQGDGPVVLTDDTSLCARARFCIRADTDAWALAFETADPERRELLIRIVEHCPSGRLAYQVPPDDQLVEAEMTPEIAVIQDGPFWVRGGIPIEASDGFEYEVRQRVTLCRCGHSRNKPFCDGSHVTVGFRDS
jgi:CDGSH-type Zn-finger protein